MEPDSSDKLPLVVIVGPTASGKTALAIELARAFGGEIICADSRTVYKGMDIGTAKPSLKEQALVPHWGLDLVEPGQRFTAADFKQYATLKIKEIRERGAVPFLVGGTGLYVDGVIFDYQFVDTQDEALRAHLAELSVEQLQNHCHKHNVSLPNNAQNKRHLIRAIELDGYSPKRRSSLIDNCIVVGVATDKEELIMRIAKRTEQLFENGVVKEAMVLGKKYDWSSESFTANVYRVVAQYLEQQISLQQAKEGTMILDRQLAKRQLTWFKRNKFIMWLPLADAEEYIAERLAKYRKA